MKLHIFAVTVPCIALIPSPDQGFGHARKTRPMFFVGWKGSGKSRETKQKTHQKISKGQSKDPFWRGISTHRRTLESQRCLHPTTRKHRSTSRPAAIDRGHPDLGAEVTEAGSKQTFHKGSETTAYLCHEFVPLVCSMKLTQ